MLKIKKYEGLVAAPFTPMDKDGNLNTDLIPEYYSFLEKNGVNGAFVNGSTGEGASMTSKERMENAKKWVKCYKAGGKVRIINLVGGTCYQECIEHAVFSYEAGIESIAMVAPYYFKPSDAGHLAEFVARVGESVPDMPVYFYHIPVLTGVHMPMKGFLEKISGMLPNFAGIKYTNEDFMDFMWCLSFKDGAYDLLWGRDECMLAALVLGTKGFIGSTYNYAAPLYNSLIKAYNNGSLDEARALQNKSIGMISLLGKYGGMATGKAFMKYIGLDCGKFRLPVSNMDYSMYDEFVRDIRKLDMEDLFSKKV
jgi:N-acetylneuraminate lyase